MEKKYEMTTATIEHEGRTLSMVKAIKDFGDVKAGDFGGFIEKEENLSHLGDAWVADKAKVYDNAAVRGDAKVFENAEIYDKAQVIGKSQVYGNAKVYDKAFIYNEAKVYDEAKVYGNAQVCENGKVYGEAEIGGYAQVCEKGEVYGEHKQSEGKITVDILSEKLTNWLDKQVADLTYGKRILTIEPSSYDDKISADTVLKAFNEYCDMVKSGKAEDFPTFENYLYEQVYDSFFTSVDYEEDYLVSEIERSLSSVPLDVRIAYQKLKDEGTSNYEILERGGYEGTEIALKEFLSYDYKLNLMFATEQERDYDMSSTVEAFRAEHITTESTILNDDLEFNAVNDNALTYLVHQQGYEIKDVYNSMCEQHEHHSGFVNSVVSEIADNYYGGMSEVTALTSAGGENLLTVLDNIAHDRGYITLSANTEIGLYNEWSGAGSALEISLEKPAVFSADMVRNVQFEDASKDLNQGYTVNDTYGLIGSVWTKGKIGVTNEEPVLVGEDMKATQAHLKKFAERQEQKQNKNKDDCER